MLALFSDACLISGCVLYFRMKPLGSALLSCLRRVKDLKTKRPWKNPLASAWVSCLRRVKDLEKNVSQEQKLPCMGYLGYICIYTGVIHVWYIRCDRDAAAAGQPPGQASPAIQRRGARGLLVSDGAQGAPLDGWAGLAAGRRRRHLDHT